MLWVDNYRPKTLDTLNVNPDLTKQLKKIVGTGDFPHLLFYGPNGAGKKTRVMALLRDHYGSGAGRVRVEQRTLKVSDSKELEIAVLVSSFHIEVNPSDAGIYDRQVIMILLKEIAESAPLVEGKRMFKVVVLNEVEKLTKGAQQALRRTMEKYMRTCRLILVTTSLSRLIPPLRSRCLSIRVPSPDKEAMKKLMIETAKKEGVKVPENLANIIAQQCEGNMRRSLLVLEATKVHNPSLENVVEPIQPEWNRFLKEIAQEILEQQSPKRIWEVRGKLYELLSNCIPPEVVLEELANNLMRLVDTSTQIKTANIAAHFEHNLRLGSKPIVHLEAFVCEFMAMYKNHLTTSAQLQMR
eukprot:TRINITY_DN14951_c0_g1_i1.p1 TRINITY_DN14951_c0_g1~~TRINITY_DN14951_c0_g1_i1.p1  ORF type:complete len:355 (+),score=74.30 TRINITY_DN14951_c0_g1_i1:52-1116(+)